MDVYSEEVPATEHDSWCGVGSDSLHCVISDDSHLVGGVGVAVVLASARFLSQKLSLLSPSPHNRWSPREANQRFR